jgi:hypothetical protein
VPEGNYRSILEGRADEALEPGRFWTRRAVYSERMTATVCLPLDNGEESELRRRCRSMCCLLIRNGGASQSGRDSRWLAGAEGVRCQLVGGCAGGFPVQDSDPV